jgi:TPR repeat protein
MKKKHKQKGNTNQSSVAAVYEYGMELYFQNNDPTSALKYLIKAAKLGYQKAYGEIGIILNRELNEPDKAEKWFIKAEKSDSLFPAARYEYGMLHYLSKEDWETGLTYLLESANQGYELAYGDIGSIVYTYKENIDEAEKWFKKAEQSDSLLAPAAYDYGVLLWLGKDSWEESFKYFQKSAEEGFEPAYGQLGTILYLEKLDIDEAEKWFERADKAGCLDAPQAHDYGMLLIEERGEIERGKKYLKMAEEDGYF